MELFDLLGSEVQILASFPICNSWVHTINGILWPATRANISALPEPLPGGSLDGNFIPPQFPGPSSMCEPFCSVDRIVFSLNSCNSIRPSKLNPLGLGENIAMVIQLVVELGVGNIWSGNVQSLLNHLHARPTCQVPTITMVFSFA